MMLALPAAAVAQQCEAGPTALVLSGGGSRGMAHIGMIQVLDSLGIRPDYVVGTSIGAVIGALYASGYRAAQIDSALRVLQLQRLFQRYNPRRPQALAGFHPLLAWSSATGGLAVAPSPARESEVNALLASVLLRANLLARGDFDRLPIPFRAVATRLKDGTPVVLRAGDVARAVRASLSIPVLFDPVTIDGDLLVDGGLASNVPVAQARALGARRVIVSDVSEGLMDTVDLGSAIRVTGHMVSLLSTQPLPPMGAGDVYARTDLTRYPSLEFDPAVAAVMIAAGRATAHRALAASPCFAATARAEPAEPRGIVGAIRAAAGADSSAGATARIAAALHLATGDSLRPGRLRADIAAAPVTIAATAVWLVAGGRGDTVDLDLAVDRARGVLAGLGVAYDYDEGGRLTLGLLDRRLLGGAVSGVALVSLDRFSQAFRLTLLRSALARHRIVSLSADARVAHDRVRVFDAAGHEALPLDTREVAGFLGVERELGARWEAALGAVVHAWREPGRSEAGGGALLRIHRVNESGTPLIRAELVLTGPYRRAGAAGEVAAGFLRRRLLVIPMGRLGWGTGLPPQAMFALGGTDGFPGLHIGERRGSREVLAGVRARFTLAGSTYLEASGQGGATGAEGHGLPEARWLLGAQLGAGAETPLGGVRIAYGRNTLGRGALFVRVGWGFPAR